MASNEQVGVFAKWPQSPRKRAALIALKVLGASCWTYAYYEAVQVARRTGKAVLPGPAIAFNLTWEAIYTSGGIWKWRDLDVEDRVQTIINAIWLACDIHLSNTLRDEKSHRNRAMFAAAITYQLLFLAKYPPGKAARMSALWQNLAFSGYCAFTADPEIDRDPSAARFTLFRAIGTAIPTTTSGMLRGIEPEYLLPGLGCAGFDVIRMARQRAVSH